MRQNYNIMKDLYITAVGNINTAKYLFRTALAFFGDKTYIEIVCGCFYWLNRFLVPDYATKHYIIHVSILMHVFLVALTAENASVAQNQGLPTKKSLKLHAWHTAHTEHSSAVVGIFTDVEKNAPKKRLELSTTLGRRRKSHSSSSVVPVAAFMSLLQQRLPALQMAGFSTAALYQ